MASTWYSSVELSRRQNSSRLTTIVSPISFDYTLFISRFRLEEGSLTEDDHEERLKSLTESYKMTGQSLHMAYSTMTDLLDAVKACQIHVNYHASVEFALAVHIQPYVNNILSVWLYIASLVPRRI